MADPSGPAGADPTAAPPPEQQRPSDADRGVIAERLRHAVDEGRLDLHEYDDRLRDAYVAKTYGELARLVSDLPAPPQAEGPVLARIGEIAVTSTTIYTPAGAMPVQGAQWALDDRWVAEQRTPTWAVVAAIVGVFFIFLFSLLFLLVKETVYRGAVQVTVTHRDQRYSTQVPVAGPAQVHYLHQQVTYLNSLAGR